MRFHRTRIDFFHYLCTMAKKKFYVVWQGCHPGIYASWEACKKEIDGCKGAKYKGFSDRLSAETAFREGPDKYWGKDVAPVIDLSAAKEQPVSQVIAVDAACSGNPGKMEYQGVYVDFGTQPASTKLQRNAKNDYLFQLIERAEKWLNENPIEVPVLKWKTEIWGEIPADFGRK